MPLKGEDPFGGAVREALEASELLDEWAGYCNDIGWCDGLYAPAERRGRIEPLVRAGEGEIFAVAEDRFYVEGVYSATVGTVLASEYFTGFEFTVEDGRVILSDAVAVEYGLGSGIGSWLSAIDDAVDVRFEDDGSVMVEAVDVVPRVVAQDGGTLLFVLELMNTDTMAAWPFVEGAHITGAEAELYNSTMEEAIANDRGTADGWSWAYGEETTLGVPSEFAVSVVYLGEQIGAGEFSLPVLDATTGSSADDARSIGELVIEIGEVERCETLIIDEDDFLTDGECMRAPVLDHQWSE